MATYDYMPMYERLNIAKTVFMGIFANCHGVSPVWILEF